jgi:hypothetical protein
LFVAILIHGQLNAFRGRSNLGAKGALPTESPRMGSSLFFLEYEKVFVRKLVKSPAQSSEAPKRCRFAFPPRFRYVFYDDALQLVLACV